jgi:fluoride exporter
LQQGRPGWACAAAAVHLTGSVLMTLAGIGTIAWIRS